MIKQIDKKTRIKLKFSITAGLMVVLALQRKKWYGWKTTSWIYPSVVEKDSIEYVEEWLKWRETYSIIKKTEKQIGVELISNGYCK